MSKERFVDLVTTTYAVLVLCVAGLTGCSEETPQDDDDSETREPSEADEEDDGEDDSSSGARTDAGGGTRADSGASTRSDATTPRPQDSGSSAQPDAGSVGDSGGSQTDAASTDSGAGDPGGMPEDLGEGDGKDVITIGDSWMLLGTGPGIEVSLEKASGRDYRNYGVPGTKLLDEVIPGQYEAAKGEDPEIKTVVMTGGGNDILQDLTLLGDCIDLGDACKAQIDKVAARLEELWAEMASDGVRDVIIVGYTRQANPFGIGSQEKSVEYSAMVIPPICAAVPEPLRCTVLDPDTIEGGVELGIDGIHPSSAGYDAIGEAVWELMQEKGMRR